MKLFSLLFLLLGILLFAVSIPAQESKNTATLSNDTQPKLAKNLELRAELLKRLAAARDVRTELVKKYNGSIPASEVASIAKTDNENTDWIKLAIEKYGWLGISLVGEDGEDAAFKMIRNSSRQPEFQKHCLELLQKAVKDSEAPAAQVALLTERINVANGQLSGAPNGISKKTINVTTVSPKSGDTPPQARNPQLRDEILQRIKSDQAARVEAVKNYSLGQKLPDEVLGRFKAADKANSDWIKEKINVYGYPGYSLVGQDGEQAAFVLIQHSDQDLEFQKKCLEMLRKAVDLKDASPASLAFLTDRVLVAEGKPQTYGTQTQIIDGEITAKPIEDEANVDKRRAAIGLEPLADYLKMMQGRYKNSGN